MINLFVVGPNGINIGNEVISFALRGLLRRQFGDEVNLVSVPACGAPSDGWVAGLTAHSCHQMNLYGHGVVVGGGNLYENGRLDVDLHALERLRPPLLLCGLSHGRIFDDHGRLVERTDSMRDDVITALNRQAVAAVVRDDATLAHHRRIGIDSARLGACPSLLVGDVLGERAAVRRDGTLLSVRAPELMSVPLRVQARVATDVRAIVDALEKDGRGPVRLVCHDRRDLAFAASLPGVEYLVPDDLSTYLALLGSASLVVTFRLHAFVPALSLGTDAVNISYDERSSSLVRSLGLGTWDIDLLTSGDVAGEVIDRVQRVDELRAMVAAEASRWTGLADGLHAALDALEGAVRAYAAGGSPHHAARSQPSSDAVRSTSDR